MSYAQLLLSENIENEEFMYNSKDNPNDYDSYSTELCKLFSTMMSVLSRRDFKDVFFISNLEQINISIMELQPNFKDFYAHGINRKKEVIGDTEEPRIDESLFFAAFPDLFQKLGTELMKIHKESEDDQ